jgi:hypothetical protein
VFENRVLVDLYLVEEAVCMSTLFLPLRRVPQICLLFTKACLTISVRSHQNYGCCQGVEPSSNF